MTDTNQAEERPHIPAYVEPEPPERSASHSRTVVSAAPAHGRRRGEPYVRRAKLCCGMDVGAPIDGFAARGMQAHIEATSCSCLTIGTKQAQVCETSIDRHWRNHAPDLWPDSNTCWPSMILTLRMVLTCLGHKSWLYTIGTHAMLLCMEALLLLLCMQTARERPVQMMNENSLSTIMNFAAPHICSVLHHLS